MGRSASQVVSTLIEQVWNGRDLAALDEVHPRRFVNEGEESTPDNARDWFHELWASFPDAHFAIDEMIEAGDRVVVRWTASGTHEGVLWGSIQPTGRRATWRGIHVLRITDGRIVDVRAVSSMASIGPQLGLEMRPTQAAVKAEV
jgi:predicted ester cyclase